MKAISLWQPWASLWLSPYKIHETRHWPLRHRGWLAVHAAKRRPDDHNDTHLGDILDYEFGHHWGIDLPFGALIGKVDIVECRRTEDIITSDDDRECGDFSPGRYGWKRGNFVRFRDPIPYRGSQGLFQVPDELLQEAVAA